MIKTVVTIAFATLASPVFAQTSDEDPNGTGIEMLGEGARQLLQRLLDQMAPAIDELEGFVDDMNAYHPPEILPNGDIIIRRRPLDDQPPPPDPDAGETIDL
ncbi:hypothetical protein [Celeribacter arenosi]